MSSSDSESETDMNSKVTQKFQDDVVSWVNIDDTIRQYRAKTKELTKEKKQYEEDILTFLENVGEKEIDITGGKLRRNVSKTKGPLKQQMIVDALLDVTGDKEKTLKMLEVIMSKRPTVERVNLKRTKRRKPKNN